MLKNGCDVTAAQSALGDERRRNCQLCERDCVRGSPRHGFLEGPCLGTARLVRRCAFRSFVGIHIAMIRGRRFP